MATMRIVPLLVLLIYAAFAVGNTIVTISVHDQKNRPIQNAEVTFSWTGECMLGLTQLSAQKATNAEGIATLPFDDSSSLCKNRADAVRDDMSARVTYIGLQDTKTIVWANEDKSADFVFTLYDINVNVRDQKNRPYSHVSVEARRAGASPLQASSDASGSAVFTMLVPNPSYVITVAAGAYQNQTSVSLDSDQSIELMLPAYDVVVAVISDDGSPIPGAVVTLTDSSGMQTVKNTNLQGQATFEQAQSGTANTFIQFGNFNSSATVVVNADKIISAIVDANPPVVIAPTWSSQDPTTKQITVSSNVQDLGANASGIRSVTLYYSLDSGGSWSAAPMSPKPGATGTFTTLISPVAEGIIVMMKVESRDNAGNAANSTETTFTSEAPKLCPFLYVLLIPLLLLFILIAKKSRA